MGKGQEYNAGVRAVGEAVDRQARERNGVLHAWLFQGDVVICRMTLFRPVEGRSIRKLRKAHQILLILPWNEAARHQLEQIARRAQQSHVDEHALRPSSRSPA